MNMQSWIGVIYGVFFSSALAYFLHNYALSKLPANRVGVFTYLEPPVAVLIAIPLLGEYPDLFFIIGSALVFVGIYLSQRHPHFRKISSQ
jgi:drug/metabolite transporter (DMT)-like permease